MLVYVLIETKRKTVVSVQVSTDRDQTENDFYRLEKEGHPVQVPRYEAVDSAIGRIMFAGDDGYSIALFEKELDS